MPAPRPKSASSPSVAVEDYLKHIWKLTASGQRCTTKALAERLTLGHGTVTGMIQQLAGRGLVKYEPYRGVWLTDSGERLALKIIRRHRLIELFLVRTLGLGWHDVHSDAERLEHAVSDQLIQRIDDYLGRPHIDPHGAPIPDAAGKLQKQDYLPLTELKPGRSGVIRRVSDWESNLLEYLHERGVRLKAKVRVIGIDPFGTMRLKVGRRELQLARQAAERIWVSSAD
jgi:DtxR family Mn-dependent transcriptional regulator